jgi:hypothetical protein
MTMADIDKTKWNLQYFLTGDGLKDWWKAAGNLWRGLAIIAGLVAFTVGAQTVIGWFIKPQQNINKPTVVVTPFSRVDKIDQTSTQISISEKTWEVGVGGGGLRYDNKDGICAFGWVKKKF